MEQRISLITLGVDDLARARRFYEEGLGWVARLAPEGVVFYQLPGIALALFGRADLEEDAHHPVDGRFSRITIAINQRTEADVDAVLAQAHAAGGTILKGAEKVLAARRALATSALVSRLAGELARSRACRLLGQSLLSGGALRHRRRLRA